MDWPKCEHLHEFGLDKQAKCKGGRLVGLVAFISAKDGPLRYDAKDYGICPACHGSGERDLTADEAAEYLTNSGIDWIAYYDCPESPYHIAERVKGFGNVVIEDGPTLTAALNAACRAVRERKEGI